FLMLAILVGVFFFGATLRGTRGWFHLGPVYVQSSEMAKILFVLSLAGYLDRRIQWYSPKSLVVPFVIAMAPIGLILLQPDLSSSLVFIPVMLVMFFSQAPGRCLAAVGLVKVLAAGILGLHHLDLLEPALSGCC
ncbi:MAG: FtsW/RodA/SpoVE family cell cycle protein, partial [Elusimicrobia bacterium]|nr:FtsW/RodA/SpoVE family cell cycle protein [Candidatus Obscuribacterium magneticum]